MFFVMHLFQIRFHEAIDYTYSLQECQQNQRPYLQVSELAGSVCLCFRIHTFTQHTPSLLPPSQLTQKISQVLSL